MAASGDSDANATALEPLLAEQIAYYRALAPAYELGALTDEGAEELEAALDAFEPSGDVLELACGTGMWTAQLARHAASLTAVGECLRPEGRVFFADDAHITPDERIAGEAGSSVRRRLRDGSEHRIVKVAHEPEQLKARLAAVGWSVRVQAASGPFYWGEGQRAPVPRI